MTKRTRSWILYLLILVFFLTGGIATLYAEGWRAELSPLAFDKVGGIYIRTLPNDADMYIEHKLIKKAIGLFDRGTLVNNLFPGTYELSVQKDGYQSWNEAVPVSASLVTSRARIVLTPKEGTTVTSTIATSIQSFGEAAFFTANGHVYRDGLLLPGNRFVAATDDGERILTASGTLNYYLTDTTTATSTPLARIVPRINTIPRGNTIFSAIPDNNSLFLIQASSSLRLLNVVTGQITTLETTSTTAFSATSARVAWTSYDATSKHSVISLYDLLSGTFLKNVDFVPGKAKKISFGDRDTLYALTEDNLKENILYQVDLTAGSRLKRASQVRDFEVAPNGSTIALADQEGISIFESRSTKRYLFFRIPDPNSIQKMVWYSDEAHLILGYKDKTSFLSFGDATLNNLQTIAASGVFAYNPRTNSVYSLKDGILTKFEMPE